MSGTVVADPLVEQAKAIEHPKPNLTASGLWGLEYSGKSFQVTQEQLDQIRAAFAKEMRRGLNRANIVIEGGVYGHRDMIKIHEDQFIVSRVSDVMGGVSLPDLSIWDPAYHAMWRAQSDLKTSKFEDAARATEEAQLHAKAAMAAFTAYREGTITGAGRSVTGLEWTRDISFAVAGIIATVATGGAGGILIGTAIGAAGTTAQQAMEVHLDMRREIDWRGIGIDAAIGVILAVLGGKIAGKVLRTPAAASLGRVIVERIVRNLLMGRAQAIVHQTLRTIIDNLSGEKDAMTGHQLAEALASQLTDPKSYFMDFLNGELGERVHIAATKAAAKRAGGGGGGSMEKVPPSQEKQQTPPSQEQAPPVQEQAAPVKEEAPPTQEQAPPTQEHAPPAQEEAPPVQERAAPVQEQAAPTQEQVPPVEEKAFTPPQEATPEQKQPPAQSEQAAPPQEKVAPPPETTPKAPPPAETPPVPEPLSSQPEPLATKDRPAGPEAATKPVPTSEGVAGAGPTAPAAAPEPTAAAPKPAAGTEPAAAAEGPAAEQTKKPTTAKKKAAAAKKAAPAKPAPAADEVKLPEGVEPSPLRTRALELINQLPSAKRKLVMDGLQKRLPKGKAGTGGRLGTLGEGLSDLGRLPNAEALSKLLELGEQKVTGKKPRAGGPFGSEEQVREHLEEESGQQVEDETEKGRTQRPEDETQATPEREPEPDQGMRIKQPKVPPRVSPEKPGADRSVLRDRALKTKQPKWVTDNPKDAEAHHVFPISEENHKVFEVLRNNGGWDYNTPEGGIMLPKRPGIKGAKKLPVHQVTSEQLRAKHAEINEARAERGQAPIPEAEGQTVKDLQGHPVYSGKVREALDKLATAKLSELGIPNPDPNALLIDHPDLLRQEVLKLQKQFKADLKNGKYGGVIF